MVAKLNGDGIAHKTERGLVKLNLSSADAVERAATELLAAARPEDGAVSLLIAQQVRGNRELIAGVLRDAASRGLRVARDDKHAVEAARLRERGQDVPQHRARERGTLG